MPANDDSPAEIHKLAITIRDLQRQSTNGWVYWTKVARQHTGSVEFVDLLVSMASLPQWQHLFATKRGVVKLTAKGIAFANSLCPQTLTEPQRIANAVIHYAARLYDTRLTVRQVTHVAKVGSKVVQAVYVELAEDHLPSDTPVRLYPNGARPIEGKIVGQEPDGSVLYVAFNTEIFQDQLPATLRIDRGFLLNRLAHQIETLSSLPVRMNALLEGNSEGFLIAHDNSLEVTNNLASLQTPWTRMLWGPPGGGKTFALGHLVATLLKNDPQSKILLVAPSNRAVDVALESVVGRLRAAGLGQLIQERRILRFGYPRKVEIIEQPELLGPTILDALSKEVKRISRLIEAAEKEQRRDVDLALLRAELLAAQEEVKTAVTEHVRNAAVVATTTTLAYLPSSPVSSQEWNTVLIDEVTMVTPAMCVFLASRAKHRFLLAGDPRQLGPVYESGRGQIPTDYDWMGRDIFDKSGVSSGSGEERQIKSEDVRLARITSQRRCASAIWGRVKHLYPEIADATNHESLQHLIDLIPSPGDAVVCLDTSGLQGKCEIDRGSWRNVISSEVAMDLAKTLVADSPTPIRVAIITPYRAQVKLLRQSLRVERTAQNTPYGGNDIEVGTVHQFQGSDADVVIFDVVDGYGRNEVGNLLKGDSGIRLVNVAITRAKGKLVVIADKEWCKRVRIHAENALLGELVLGSRPTKTLIVQRRLQPDSSSPTNFSSERDKTESPIEIALFDAMAKTPILATVRSQVLIRDQSGIPISRADFAFEDVKYAIYCDGRKWHLKEDRWEVDLRQRNKLTEIGWIFSVFSGRQILTDADSCAAQIAETYSRRLDPDAGSRTKATKKNATQEAGEKEGVGQRKNESCRKDEDCKNEDGQAAGPTPSKQDGVFQVPAPDAIMQIRQPGQVVTNILGVSFVWIPSGTYMMGSPADEGEREADETQYRVTLTKGFYMSVCPVTQNQWMAVMGKNPSQFKNDNLPVERVSWQDCVNFCEILRKKDSKPYRLPSEAEWEYACRAGTITPFHFGETISTDQVNFDCSRVYGDGEHGINRRQTTPVQQFSPNSWGLYDVHGNVWEWCSDWYGAYPTEECFDYQGPMNGAKRVIRGGAWNQIPSRCRSAYRDGSDPRRGQKHIGFRICFSDE